MSEQTPNSSDTLNGSEPSMEDILASIRKIIADDEPVAMESPEDVAAPIVAEAAESNDLDDLLDEIRPETADLTSDAVRDLAEDTQANLATPVAESVDLNVEDVLAGLQDDVLAPEDTLGSDFAENATAEETATVALDDILLEDLTAEAEIQATTSEIGEDGLLVEKPEEISFGGAEDSSALQDLVSESPAASGSDEVDDIDALLNGLLGDDGDDIIEDIDNLAETDLEAQTAASVGDTEDLDLVKSLMADLADDPEVIETDEDLDALLSIPEVEDTSADVSGAEAETEEDVLGEILDMTIEDEIQSHPEDIAVEGLDDSTDLSELVLPEGVAEAEQENIAENADLDSEVLPDTLLGEIGDADAEVEGLPSLSEIAAAAEADAVAVETAALPPAAGVAGIGALAGIAAVATTAAVTQSSEETLPEAEIAAEDILSEEVLVDESADENLAAQVEPTDIKTESTLKTDIAPKSLPNQETEMPVKAVPTTDTILDDVTQTATAGAFAELNQVVEDKAIFNERGPRIGDLVQDALRPMLKEWLDANLKGIVERAVTKEVKRISSGK